MPDGLHAQNPLVQAHSRRLLTFSWDLLALLVNGFGNSDGSKDLHGAEKLYCCQRTHRVVLCHMPAWPHGVAQSAGVLCAARRETASACLCRCPENE